MWMKKGEDDMIHENRSYKFWGWERAKQISSITQEYKGIKTPWDLYDVLCNVWCEYTCAPRLRDGWSKENRTLGQCSITAFLAQDIFGGKVYGILRPGGNYHCYNVIGDVAFDLTSEQFGEEILDYENNPEQFRKVHFAKEEKLLRYEYLRKKVMKMQSDRKLIKGIHHVSMKCCSVEEYDKTIRFYKDILGLEVVRTWNAGIMLQAGNNRIEIFNNGDAALGKGVIQHFAFATDDVDACAKAITDAGYEVFIQPRDIQIASKPPFPARIAFCYGPLGEEIEFFQEK